MNLSSVLNNPVLGYRLDPGEPGVLRSSSARDSARAVTSQEQHNSHRLQSEALMSGRIVVATNISYSHARAGSYMAVTAGLTTVISKPGPRPLTRTKQALAAYRAHQARPSSETGLHSAAGPLAYLAGMPASETGVSGIALMKREGEVEARIRELNRKLASGGGSQPALENERRKTVRDLNALERLRLFPRAAFPGFTAGAASLVDISV